MALTVESLPTILDSNLDAFMEETRAAAQLFGLFDCHCHLADPLFQSSPSVERSSDAEYLSVLEQSSHYGLRGIAVVAENAQESQLILRGLIPPPAHVYESTTLFPAVGIHPCHVPTSESELSTQLEQLESLVKQASASSSSSSSPIGPIPLLAIGECGLDRTPRLISTAWNNDEEKMNQFQIRAFERQCQLAIQHDLPINVHSRAAGHYAIDICKKLGVRRALFHAFDGRKAHAKRGADYGFHFSIPGSAIRDAQTKILAAELPSHSIVLESDAPALHPLPGAGRRNEPGLGVAVALRVVAEARRVALDEAAKLTTKNAINLFPGFKAALSPEALQLLA